MALRCESGVARFAFGPQPALPLSLIPDFGCFRACFCFQSRGPDPLRAQRRRAGAHSPRDQKRCKNARPGAERRGEGLGRPRAQAPVRAGPCYRAWSGSRRRHARGLDGELQARSPPRAGAARAGSGDRVRPRCGTCHCPLKEKSPRRPPSPSPPTGPPSPSPPIGPPSPPPPAKHRQSRHTPRRGVPRYVSPFVGARYPVQSQGKWGRGRSAHRLYTLVDLSAQSGGASNLPSPWERPGVGSKDIYFYAHGLCASLAAPSNHGGRLRLRQPLRARASAAGPAAAVSVCVHQLRRVGGGGADPVAGLERALRVGRRPLPQKGGEPLHPLAVPRALLV